MQKDDSAVRRFIDRSVQALHQHVAGTFSRETVERCLIDSLERIGPEPPSEMALRVAEGITRDRLSQRAIWRKMTQKQTPEVLFVCVHNAGRSQMAAALLERYAEGRVRVHSAGSAPADTINPAVREAMSEIGLDLSEAKPKKLDDRMVHVSDVVITMGCGDACPIFPGKRYEDWELEDPAGKDIAAVRKIRDDIDARVQQLAKNLLQETVENA